MPRWWEERPDILKMDLEGQYCLDVGCGDGDAKRLVQRRGYCWIGLDIKRSREITVCGDAHNLPFKNAVFNGVVSFKTLEHLHNPFQVLQEIKRVMRDGGHFVGDVAFLEPEHDSYYHFTRLGVENILAKNGFIVEEISSGWNCFESIVVMMMGNVDPKQWSIKLLVTISLGFYKLLCLIRKRLSKNNISKMDEMHYAGEIRFISKLKRETKVSSGASR